ncbi:MAG: hypothetical protein HQK89_00675 [Nitrospirae bacterium]|nr:hypothetical protein [Nitrospirota bacterium]
MRGVMKLSILVCLVILSGCSFFMAGLDTIKSTSDFIPLEADRRVLYEQGAEDLAKVVAAQLPEAIAAVEKGQYRPFPKPVSVYVCATEASFTDYTGAKQARGVVVVGKVFISGKLKKREYQDAIPGILAYELSHVHLQQQLGAYNYEVLLPSWFQKGLATMVSNGRSAENVSQADAIKAISQGKTFKPDTEGSLLFAKTSASYGLTTQMFYRQSSMFVSYLKDLDNAKFEKFLLMVEDSKNFKDSFSSVYEMSIDTAWNNFIQIYKST